MAAIFHAEDGNMLSSNLQKRYNELVMVRTRATRRKGAWYWSYLEPILFQNQDTGTVKALKLRCGLCNALFSASNPSRTASEQHLKHGICPNFRNEITPKFRKNNHLLPSLAMLPSACPIKLIIPPSSINMPQLTQTQIDTAFDLLADWFYESNSQVSVSTLNHPKYKAFIHQVGLPQENLNFILGKRLENKYVEAKFEFDDKLHNAMFFQLSTNGWKNQDPKISTQKEAFVNVTLNLPNGTSQFHQVLFLGAIKPNSSNIREVLSSIIDEVSDGDVSRCAGVVADVGNDNNEALRALEF